MRVMGWLGWMNKPGGRTDGRTNIGGADLMLLVIAADEGVCPQTREGIEFAKTFGAPVVVVLTKCDLPNARPKEVVSACVRASVRKSPPRNMWRVIPLRRNFFFFFFFRFLLETTKAS